MTRLPHLVFTGGGTAGHLFPGLALAEQLTALARVTFVGSGKEFERRHVAAAGYEYLALPCQPLPTRLQHGWRFFWDHFRGRRAARHFLRKQQVATVVGLGGYASVPMARAAISLGVPLVLLEQNAVAGRATRWLAPSAELVCTAFETTRDTLNSAGPIRAVGNPTRAALGPLFLRDTARHDDSAPRQLLILGGSGGARALNEAVPRALYKLKENLRDWQIVHQSGRNDVSATRELYDKLDIPARVAAFLHDVPGVLSRTSLAVSRAGGTTLAELALAGVPAVLVPYPQATDDHQRRNADVYLSAGAVRLVDDRQVSGRLHDALAATIDPLLRDAWQRRVMSVAMRGLARPDAAWHAAAMILDVARSRRRPAA